jgi:hypothetical protein
MSLQQLQQRSQLRLQTPHACARLSVTLHAPLSLLPLLLPLLLLLLSCSGCPVPRDQQPIQELKQLQVTDSCMTDSCMTDSCMGHLQ